MTALNYVNASSWNFDDTDLTGSYFEKVELINASFKNANMTAMDLSHCRDIFAINIANAVINETLFNEDIIKWLEIEFDLTGIRIANLKHECINYDDYKNGYNDRWYRYGDDNISL